MSTWRKSRVLACHKMYDLCLPVCKTNHQVSPLACMPEARSTGNSQRSDSQPGDTITGWQFDKDVPALVHPIVNSRRHSLLSNMQALSNQNPVDWIVVVLNLDYIQRRLLPDLTKRYFSGRAGLEYNLAVLATGPRPHFIYSSGPEFPSTMDSSLDSRMNIFGPPPQSVEGNFWRTIKNSQALRQEDWRSFSAPVWFPVIRYTSTDDPWMLLLQNRTGPIDAIVTSIWRRNVTTGTVALGLLRQSAGAKACKAEAGLRRVCFA